ncbi:MAG: PAS domain-containing protein [Planctomycetes bacterium]|nr:PAS domain-containing protein [Planctomycetota bacterium]
MNELVLDTSQSDLDQTGKREVAGRDAPTEFFTALSLLGRQVDRAADLSSLMEEAGCLAVKSLGVDGFSVAECIGQDRFELRFWRMANGKPELAGKRQIDNAPANSATAYAINAGCVVTFSDLAKQTDFGDLFLKQHGVSCGIVAPLTNANQSFGAVGVFGRERREFDGQDILFVELMAHLLGAAAACQRARSEVEEQASFISATIDALDSMLLVLGPDGTIRKTNKACDRISEFQFEEIRDRSLWSAFLVPEEAEAMDQAFQQLKRGEYPVRLETSLLTKYGQRLRIAWSLTPQHGPDEQHHAIVVSGIDVTQRHEAFELLKEFTRTELVSDELPPGVKDDRRQHQRRDCPYIQKIAPIVDGNLPDLDDFFEVQGKDISARGFAFLLPEPTEHSELVIAFGSPPSRVYLIASVVHVTRTRIDGQDMYIVGCCYQGRVNYNSK